MSLDQLFRHTKKALLAKKALVATAMITTSVVAFTKYYLPQYPGSDNTSANRSSASSTSSDSASSSGTSSGSAATAAGSGSASGSTSGSGGTASTGSTGGSTSTASSMSHMAASNFNADACMKNPTLQNCDDPSITQAEWDQFLPPEGLVVRDAHGNVIFKKCRSLTEGAKTAQAEMQQEKARFDKFNAAMNVSASSTNNYRDGNSGSSCSVQPKTAAPKELPCPTYQNYSQMRDYYRQQYYDMSNRLQSLAATDYSCGQVRDSVMAAVDPNWKSDRGISSAPSVGSASSNAGRH